MKNNNIINPITGKVSLFNEHDTYTDEGSDLCRDFDNHIRNFVTDAHKKHSSQEIEIILTTCIQMMCCGVRINRDVELAKKARQEKLNAYANIAKREMENIILFTDSKYWENDKPRVIPIIKHIRDITNWNLKDSKDYVYAFFKKNNIKINA